MAAEKETKAPSRTDAASDPAPAAETSAETAPAEASAPVAEAPSGPDTVLTPALRDGRELAPGDAIEFRPEESAHRAELIASKAVHPGTGKAAQAAVESAERARELARNTPPA